MAEASGKPGPELGCAALPVARRETRGLSALLGGFVPTLLLIGTLAGVELSRRNADPWVSTPPTRVFAAPLLTPAAVAPLPLEARRVQHAASPAVILPPIAPPRQALAPMTPRPAPLPLGGAPRLKAIAQVPVALGTPPLRERTAPGLCELPATLDKSAVTAGLMSTEFGRRLAAAALAQTRDLVIYDARYVRIGYPMGDVAPLYGVCTDVVVRAYRALGIDLQELVYRTRSGTGDTNIDHRRTEVLRRFFSRFAETIPLSGDPESFKPGDIVTYYPPAGRRNAPAHIAIVSDRIGPSGHPMIVHNKIRGPEIEDALFYRPMSGHYRFEGLPDVELTALPNDRPSGALAPGQRIALAGVARVRRIVRAPRGAPATLSAVIARQRALEPGPQDVAAAPATRPGSRALAAGAPLPARSTAIPQPARPAPVVASKRLPLCSPAQDPRLRARIAHLCSPEANRKAGLGHTGSRVRVARRGN